MSRAEILALIREIAEHEAELEARTVPYEARIDDKSMNHLRRSVTARYAEDLYERLDRAGVDMWFGESDRMAVKSATTEWRQSRGYDALRAAYRASIGEAAPSIAIDESRDRARAAAEKREIERKEAEAAATAERERLAAERRAKEAAEAAAHERARLEQEKVDAERRVKAAEEAARAAEQERFDRERNEAIRTAVVPLTTDEMQAAYEQHARQFHEANGRWPSESADGDFKRQHTLSRDRLRELRNGFGQSCPDFEAFRRGGAPMK
jgi:hypothetical protein